MSATATVPQVAVDLVRLGAVIREAREGLGKPAPSQQKLAEVVGISKNAWSRMERGANDELSLDRLEAVAQVLGLTLQELLVRAGIIQAEVPTREAILSDPALSEAAKRTVLDVYEGFARLSG